MRLISILLLFATVSQAAHVQFDFRDFVTGNIQRQPVKILPLSAPTPSGTNVIMGQEIYTNTAEGTIVVSNIVAGNYRVTVRPAAPLRASTFDITVPDSASLLSASSLYSGPTNSAVFASFDSRYARANAQVTLTYSGTTNVSMDCSLANVFYLLATNNFYLRFTNGAPGYSAMVHIVQDGTGSRLMTYDASVTKTNATMALSTAANSWDVLSMVVRTNSAGTNFAAVLTKAFQ